jgi:hypothetical protein
MELVLCEILKLFKIIIYKLLAQISIKHTMQSVF